MVRLDGIRYSDFQWNGYLWWLVEPGEHVIRVVCDLPDHPRPSGLDLSGAIVIYALFDAMGLIKYPPCLPASITITANNGEVVIIEHHFEPHGFSQAKSTLQMVDAPEGREAIENRRLVYKTAPD